MPMDPGKRDRLVTFERFTATTNDLNEEVRTWAEVGGTGNGTEWAAREDVSDTELIAAGELGASLGARFVVLRNSVTETITPKDRLKTDDDAIWNIKAVREKKGAGKALLEIRAAREVG